MTLIVGLRLVLLVGALVLGGFDVIVSNGKNPLSWAVLFLAIALLLR